MAGNDKNLCNAVREQWRMLIVLIQNTSQILNKMLNNIRSLVDRIVNSHINLISGILRDSRDILGAVLGLAEIDNAAIRQDYCRVLYACEPAIKLVLKSLSSDVYDWIYSPSRTSTPDWSKWGIPSINFNSKYEVYEYVACRLSLNNLYNSVVNTQIDNLMSFISKYRQYLTVDWWLQNTVVGRVLTRAMKDYEDFFNNYILKYMNMLYPYLNCGFAVCDFSTATTNYFEDFKSKYYIGINNTPDVGDRFKFYKEDLLSALNSSMNQAKSDLDQIVPSKAKNNSGTNSNDSSTLPFNGSEEARFNNNSKSTKSSALTTSDVKSDSYRVVQTIVSPTSIGLA